MLTNTALISIYLYGNLENQSVNLTINRLRFAYFCNAVKTNETC